MHLYAVHGNINTTFYISIGYQEIFVQPHPKKIHIHSRACLTMLIHTLGVPQTFLSGIMVAKFDLSRNQFGGEVRSVFV